MKPFKCESAIGMNQLAKSLGHPELKYGTWLYGFDKLRFMKEKQHNNGQQGAGLARYKMQAAPESYFSFIESSIGYGAVIFNRNSTIIQTTQKTSKQQHHADLTARCVGVVANYKMGHLR